MPRSWPFSNHINEYIRTFAYMKQLHLISILWSFVDSYKIFPNFKISLDFKIPEMCFRTFGVKSYVLKMNLKKENLMKCSISNFQQLSFEVTLLGCKNDWLKFVGMIPNLNVYFKYRCCVYYFPGPFVNPPPVIPNC